MVRRRNGESSIPSSYGQGVYKEGRMNGSVFLNANESTQVSSETDER